MIRPLNQQDACQLMRVYKYCFSSNAWTSEVFRDYFIKPEWNGVFGYGYFSLISPLNHDYSLSDELLIGFIMGRTICESNDLLTIAVHPDYQSMGIGAALCKTYIDALTVDCLLEVSIQNKKAIRLYTSFGFDVITIRKGYYVTELDSPDAYVMKRSV